MKHPHEDISQRISNQSEAIERAFDSHCRVDFIHSRQTVCGGLGLSPGAIRESRKSHS